MPQPPKQVVSHISAPHTTPCRATEAAVAQAARGSGGVTIPGDAQKTCRYGTSGHGLAGMVVMD